VQVNVFASYVVVMLHVSGHLASMSKMTLQLTKTLTQALIVRHDIEVTA